MCPYLCPQSTTVSACNTNIFQLLCFEAVLVFRISDFEISYQLPQSTENGKRPDVFISLTSDFDLDAAFMSSSLPYLSLKIEPVICSGNFCWFIKVAEHSFLYLCLFLKNLLVKFHEILDRLLARWASTFWMPVFQILAKSLIIGSSSWEIGMFPRKPLKCSVSIF